MKISTSNISRQMGAVRPRGTLHLPGKSRGFFYAQTRAERKLMGKKYYRYKVTGIIRFHLDDIFADSPEEAKVVTAALVKDAITGASCNTNMDDTEVFDLNAKIVRPATKKEISDYVPE